MVERLRFSNPKPFACRVFGCKPHKAWGSPGYGTPHGGHIDGIGREHWTLYLTCDRCDNHVDVGRFHGPLRDPSTPPK